jgi:hypothetical protein
VATKRIKSLKTKNKTNRRRCTGTTAVHRHRFDVSQDPDSNPILHSDADPDPDPNPNPDPTVRYTFWIINKIKNLSLRSKVSCFHYFGQHIIIFWKQCILSLLMA